MEGDGTTYVGHVEDALGRCPGRFEIVHLEVPPENAAGRRLCETFGFVVPGRLPRAFRRAGVCRDLIRMRRAIALAAEPPPRP